MKRPRAVIDTNVFVSAVLFSGALGSLLSFWQQGKFIYLMSYPVLEEYIKVLSYPKFNLTVEDTKYILEKELLPFVESVRRVPDLVVVKSDPADDKFVSLAVAGKADMIVSGDRHLLDIKRVKSIPVVAAKEFLSFLDDSA